MSHAIKRSLSASNSPKSPSARSTATSSTLYLEDGQSSGAQKEEKDSGGQNQDTGTIRIFETYEWNAVNVMDQLREMSVALSEMQNKIQGLSDRLDGLQEEMGALKRKINDQDERELNALLRKYAMGRSPPIPFVASHTSTPISKGCCSSVRTDKKPMPTTT